MWKYIETMYTFSFRGEREVSRPQEDSIWWHFFQDDFDNDVDALLEEGLRAPKTRRVENEKYGGESDHQSDGETSVQPMMTKIKTVLKSKLMLVKYL